MIYAVLVAVLAVREISHAWAESLWRKERARLTAAIVARVPEAILRPDAPKRSEPAPKTINPIGL